MSDGEVLENRRAVKTNAQPRSVLFASFVSLLAAIIVSGFAARSTAAPLPYQVIELGLTGPEHTRADGYKYNESARLNGAGQVIGYARRFGGGNADLGRSAWLYNGSDTRNIGLTDFEHTRSDGYQVSVARELNEAGRVAGYSQRFDGGKQNGTTAWLFDGLTTIDIGPVGQEYTRADGYRESTPIEFNEAGWVAGHANRYNGGSTYLGRSAWLYKGSTAFDVGPSSSEYTRNDGLRSSYITNMNEAGYVIGEATRYLGGSASRGQSAWLYSGATTLNIGLTQSEHTRSDGFQFASPQAINSAGQVTGHSHLYSAGGGQSAWLYDGLQTRELGLTGSAYTRDDGYKYSSNLDLNDAGQVAGISNRYSGSVARGVSAWFYDGKTTTEIGPTESDYSRDGLKYNVPQGLNEAGEVIGYAQRYVGSEPGLATWLYDGATTRLIGLAAAKHTRSDGHQYNLPDALNEAGQVIGHSRVFAGDNWVGQSAWLYDGTNTLDIGLTGSQYVGEGGYEYSVPEQLNESGQVAGYSNRFAGATQLGQDAWVFDPALGTVPLQLSLRADGYAFSSIEYFDDQGLAIGYYSLYSDMTLLGDRAFYWTPTDGLWDLGLLVNGELLNSGWETLARGLRAHGVEYLSGFGLATNLPVGSRSEFLLVQVPEPGSIVLAGVAAAGMALCALRRRYAASRPSV